MNRLIFFSILFFTSFLSQAQIPIGAQVYIEPGQQPEQIEKLFSTLKAHGMTVCRIRMDETYMRTANGLDFSLFDKAFDEAEKNGVKIFATIFPGETNPEGVGGFKFPESDAHHQQVATFIKELVSHFNGHPALKAWVLQNEPGVGDLPTTQFSQKRFNEWKEKRIDDPVYNQYTRKHQDEGEFLFEYTTWYLNWLATEIKKYDAESELHVNNHMIFELLPEYNFVSWRKFLNHLGASMHPSWHFGYFDREQYPLAISANCNLIKNGAGNLPFWVTELQAGNNNFSGFNPMMPTAKEIQQWLLTSIFSGTEGIIFWTLNARSVGFEAGEWALIDYQNNPTDRLIATKGITKLLQEYPDLSKAKPITSDIHVLYSRPSMSYQKNAELSSSYIQSDFDARKKGAHIKSALGYYNELLRQGIVPEFVSLQAFDWENETGTVILPNMVIMPRTYFSKIENFVQRGGNIIMTGQSGHLDEYQYNVLQIGWELTDIFGAKIKEFEMVADSFSIKYNQHQLPAHFMRGKLQVTTAKPLIQSDSGEIYGTENKFGKGKAIWIPSMLGLGSWKFKGADLGKFVTELIGKNSSKTYPDNLIIQHMESDDFHYTLVMNTTGEEQSIESEVAKLKNPKVIFGGKEEFNKSIKNNGVLVLQSEK